LAGVVEDENSVDHGICGESEGGIIEERQERKDDKRW